MAQDVHDAVPVGRPGSDDKPYDKYRYEDENETVNDIVNDTTNDIANEIINDTTGEDIVNDIVNDIYSPVNEIDDTNTQVNEIQNNEEII